LSSTFFQFLENFFRSQPFELVLPSSSPIILSQVFPFVKNFFILFKIYFPVCLSAGCPLSSDSISIPHPPLFVNLFFLFSLLLCTLRRVFIDYYSIICYTISIFDQIEGIRMNNFLFAFNAVFPIFFLMAVGFFLRYFKMGSEEFFSKANKISFKVLLPVMLFLNIYDLEPVSNSDYRYILLAILATFVIAGVGMILVPRFVKDKKKIGVMIQSFFRSNFLIFGVPMVRSMFGESELWATTVLLPISIPIFNVLAVIVLSIYINEDRSVRGLKKTVIGILKNPLILGTIAAIIVKVSGFKIPPALYSPLDSLGSIASPLALLALGATLKFSTIRQNFKYLLTSCSVRLIAVPALVLPAAIAMGFRGSTIGALLALFASPTAVSSYVMAEASGNDGELAGQIVAVTTTVSLLTMFLWIYFLRSIAVL